jgi:hypothetical protein
MTKLHITFIQHIELDCYFLVEGLSESDSMRLDCSINSVFLLTPQDIGMLALET